MRNPELRARAENAIADGLTKHKRGDDDVWPLTYELHVHAVELEMQNDELRRTQLELERTRDWLQELFDRAPIPYLTFSRDTTIVEANAKASELVGASATDLLGKRFTSLLAESSVEPFELYRRRLFDSISQQSCDVALTLADGTSIPVRLESLVGSRTHARSRARVAVIDLRELRELGAGVPGDRPRGDSRDVSGVALSPDVMTDVSNLFQGLRGCVDRLADALAYADPARIHLDQLRSAVDRGAALARAITGADGAGSSDGSAPDAPPTLDTFAPRGDATILLVDEDRLVRSALRFYLEEAGYRVLEATGKEAAIECCQRYPGPIDLLVTEERLRSGSGRDLAAHVRSLRPSAASLFTNTCGSPPDAPGVERHEPPIAKPFMREHLLACVRRALARDSQRPTRSGLLRRPSVLIVDENEAARGVLRGYLEEVGWEVLGAGDAREASVLVAERLLQGTRVDVLLSDATIPARTVEELAERLRQVSPDLRLVYMAAGSLPEPRPKGPTVKKPLHLDELRRTLRDALGRAG